MTDFDRITTESWTIAFPSDWIDRSEGEDTQHPLRLSDADRGSYFDWQGFFTMLGVTLAVIAGTALLAAMFN